MDAGCTCPIEANNDGLYPPVGRQWWISPGCPLHASWLQHARRKREREQ